MLLTAEGLVPPFNVCFLRHAVYRVSYIVDISCPRLIKTVVLVADRIGEQPFNQFDYLQTGNVGRVSWFVW